MPLSRKSSSGSRGGLGSLKLGGQQNQQPPTYSFRPSPPPPPPPSSSSFLSPPQPPPPSTTTTTTSSFLPTSTLSSSLPPTVTSSSSSSKAPSLQNNFSFSNSLAGTTTTLHSSVLLPKDYYDSTTTTTLTTNNKINNVNDPKLNSTSLSCISPNHKIVFSLSTSSPLSTQSSNYNESSSSSSSSLYIISNFLPLENSTFHHNLNQELKDEKKSGDDTEEEEEVKSVIVSLPTHIVDACTIDSPIGFICVDNDDSTNTSFQKNRVGGNNKKKKMLPWLCLYTRKSAYLLQISYSPSSSSSSSSSYTTKLVEGEVIQCHEPFEDYLLSSSTNTSIVRIKSAPNSNDMICAPCSMAMLTTEYALVLYHGNTTTTTSTTTTGSNTRGFITTPLQFQAEEELSSSSSSSSEKYIDFCFMTSSSSLKIFSMTSILLLKSNGCVHGASPILFDQSIVSTQIVKDGVDYLQGEMIRLESLKESEGEEEEEKKKMARYKMCRASKQFLLDAFGPAVVGATSSSSSSGRNNAPYYVTSYIASGIPPYGDNSGKSSTLWPVQLQGPLLSSSYFASEEEEEEEEYENRNEALVIESFGYRRSTTTTTTTSSSIGGCTVDGIVIATSSSSSSEGKEEEEVAKQKLYFGIFPGGMTTLLPRFAFETFEDTTILDDGIYNCGAIVECLQFQEDDDDGITTKVEEEYYSSTVMSRKEKGGGGGGVDCAIVIDPVKNDMIHYVSSKGVFTITTNVLSVYAHKIAEEVDGASTATTTPGGGYGGETRRSYRGADENKKKEVELRTNAWSCLEVSGGGGVTGEDYENYSGGGGGGGSSSKGVSLLGVVVSGDAHLGHVLVATLSDGTMEAVNITAAQYLHEASALDTSTSTTDPTSPHYQKQPVNKATIESDEALKVMQSIQPLHESLAPLMKQVVTGLSTMGKIVGSQTKPSEANPSSIATFISTKKKCETDILLPLQEMNVLSSNRMSILQDMHAHQQKQIQQLQHMVDTLKKRMKVTAEKKMIAESNANILAQRSSAVLAASRDLLPTITDAEREYFGQLKRYEVNCKKWEGLVETVQNKCAMLCDGMDPSTASCKVRLSEEQVNQCLDLLAAQGNLLKKQGKKMDNVENAMKGLVVATGYGDGEDEEEGEGKDEPLAIISRAH